MKPILRFPKIYFGWWTVLASGFLALWGHGFNAYGISALFKPIATELGFNRTMTSVASSIGRLEGGLEAPITGWITDRFGPKGDRLQPLVVRSSSPTPTGPGERFHLCRSITEQIGPSIFLPMMKREKGAGPAKEGSRGGHLKG